MSGTPLSELPPAALVALAVLGVVQISLLVWSLVDLVRRDRVVGGRKWLWLLLILFVNVIGPIVYLAVGRKVPAEAVDPLSARAGRGTGGDRAEQAADVLYGKH